MYALYVPRCPLKSDLRWLIAYLRQLGMGLSTRKEFFVCEYEITRYVYDQLSTNNLVFAHLAKL